MHSPKKQLDLINPIYAKTHVPPTNIAWTNLREREFVMRNVNSSDSMNDIIICPCPATNKTVQLVVALVARRNAK